MPETRSAIPYGVVGQISIPVDDEAVREPLSHEASSPFFEGLWVGRNFFGRIPDALQDAVVSGDPFHASFQGQRIELRCFASAPVSLRLIDMFLCLRQVWVFFVANIQYGVCFDPVVPNSVAGHDMTVRDLLCIWGPDPDEDIVI